MVIRWNSHNVRIANREDPDQTASSDLCLHCLSRHIWQATIVRNFGTFTVTFMAPVENMNIKRNSL